MRGDIDSVADHMTSSPMAASVFRDSHWENECKEEDEGPVRRNQAERHVPTWTFRFTQPDMHKS